MQKDLLKAKETLYRLAANVKLLPDRSVIKIRGGYWINLSAVGDGSKLVMYSTNITNFNKITIDTAVAYSQNY